MISLSKKKMAMDSRVRENRVRENSEICGETVVEWDVFLFSPTSLGEII